MLVIIQKHIVTILSDIRHKHILVGKAISALWPKSEPSKMFRNLLVVRASVRPHGLLTEHQPCFMKILCNTQELKAAIRKENVMDNVLEQNILWRVLFEVQLGKRVLDFVILPLLLDKPHLAFTRAYRVARSRDGSRFHEESDSLRGGYQDAALPAYLI